MIEKALKELRNLKMTDGLTLEKSAYAENVKIIEIFLESQLKEAALWGAENLVMEKKQLSLERRKITGFNEAVKIQGKLFNNLKKLLSKGS